eukprot:876217-Amphidinium_carterae.1
MKTHEQNGTKRGPREETLLRKGVWAAEFFKRILAGSYVEARCAYGCCSQRGASLRACMT